MSPRNEAASSEVSVMPKDPAISRIWSTEGSRTGMVLPHRETQGIKSGLVYASRWRSGKPGVMCITVKKQGSLAWFLKFDLRSRNPFPRTCLGEVMGSLQVHPKFG